MFVRVVGARLEMDDVWTENLRSSDAIWLSLTILNLNFLLRFSGRGEASGVVGIPDQDMWCIRDAFDDGGSPRVTLPVWKLVL